ncbi:Ras-related protein RABA5e [Camellia lanceoleosa]|uniref:Ras-related protein RABA5e n=1 Tax=Camellia lanceoleosa TaxID=1840588 RepID=A0ACC0FUA7_9ERIC|nr:Ras-related protein RABA5e [Camellia lanceoleosa]
MARRSKPRSGTPLAKSASAVSSAYYRGIVGALIVYDITRWTTFDSIKWWLNELKNQREAIYGLTEIYRREIQDANLVANPGC